MERIGGLPEAFEHVHLVDDDRDVDAELASGLLREANLIAVPVDEHDQPALHLGIASARLLEGVADHDLGILLDARPDALRLGDTGGSWRGLRGL